MLPEPAAAPAQWQAAADPARGSIRWLCLRRLCRLMHIHQRAVDGDDKAQRGDWPEDKVRQPAHGIESALLFQLFTDIVQRLMA
ncbi:hypothetical protein AB9K36_02510 [Klebsiella michiganensis]